MTLTLEKRIGFFLIGVVLSATCSWVQAEGLQGYYTEEEVRIFHPLGSPDKIITRKSWYAGDRMRKDEQWEGITIARFDLGRIYLLDTHTRTYVEVSSDFLQKNSESVLAGFGLPAEDGKGIYFPDDLYIRTETTKEIGRWSCYQVMTNPKYRTPDSPYVVIWYSTDVDFPVQVFGEQLKQLFGDSPTVEGLFDRLSKFEGYPVRTEAHGSNTVTTTTLYKIEYRRDIDPSLFEIPEDYNGVELPEDMTGVQRTP